MSDTLKAIRLGGDDYLIKPFRHELLEAKIEAALRRNEEYQKPKIVELGYDLSYHMQLQSLRYKQEEVDLTPTERKLFYELVRKKVVLFPGPISCFPYGKRMNSSRTGRYRP